jgi:hypothetical protein
MITSNIKFLGVDSSKVDLTEKKDALNNAITEYYTLEDFKPAYINYFDFSSASVTDIVTEDTWVKLNTNTTSLFSRDGLVHTNNRVTNTGGKKVFKIEGIVSVASGNNNEIHTAFFKNEALHPCSEQSTVTNSGNKVNALPFHCLIELDTNDFIEVYVKNKLNTTDITLGNVNVIVTEI